MNPSRWQQIKEVFAAAEKLSIGERKSFIHRACPKDAELQLEIERLLGWRDRADSFLAQFADDVSEQMRPQAEATAVAWQLVEDRFAKGLRASEDQRDLLLNDLTIEAAAIVQVLWATVAQTRRPGRAPTLSTGDRIGLYEVVSQLGCGGMGEVYLARDYRLNRDVAIKVLPEAFAADTERVSRLQREGQAASALKHPNIVTVYELGETQGRPFLVTEFIEGQTLKDKLADGFFSVDRALEVAIELACGLQAAHEQGVVHRDIKPANIMVLPDGRVKIVDFGLALYCEDRTLTAIGAVMGSPPYMSPEQRYGELVDARTDIWSLGVVVFEMIAGRLPSSQAATLAPAVFSPTSSHDRLRDLFPGVPEKLDAIVSKCMAIDRRDRYQCAADLLSDLRLLRTTNDTYPVRSWASIKRLWPVFAVGGAAALFWGSSIWYQQPSQSNPRQRSSVAVLPFKNTSLDPKQEYLADGTTDELIGALSKISSIRVISLKSVIRYKHVLKPLTEVSRELGVDAVVEGSVVQIGDNVRLTVKLVHTPSNETRWTKTYDRPLQGLPLLHGEMARAIASASRLVVTSEEATRLGISSVVNPKAYELFLQGQSARNEPGEAGLRDAIVKFKKATLHEPDFSLAHAGIADAWFWLSSWYLRPHDAMPHAKAAAMRALEADPQLADAHSVLGNVALFYDWNWPAAKRHFRRAIDLNPNSAAAHRGYSDYLLSQRHFEESIEQGRMAIDLDPFSLTMRASYLLSLVTAGRNDEAIKEAQRALDVEPSFSLALLVRGLAHSGKKLHTQAMQDLEEAVEIERSPTNLLFLAYVQAAAGHRQRAFPVIQELRRTAGKRYVCPFELAMVYAAFGDAEEAFRWMEKAFAERADCMALLAAEPWMEAIRKDPRYPGLLRRVGLEDAAGRR